MATIIENLKSKISQGAVVGSPFNLRGVAPNFNRDRIDSIEELGAVTKDDNIYDIGHLVYCAENENIYISNSNKDNDNSLKRFIQYCLDNEINEQKKDAICFLGEKKRKML